MIRRFINKLLKKPTGQKKLIHGHALMAQKINKRTHRINPELLSKNAVKVTHVLQDAGYDAYIVGGAVRDLLLGIAPKDFDVATNATPEQVKGLFRRAFIIGRRFRIVHVVYGRGRDNEVIEIGRASCREGVLRLV